MGIALDLVQKDQGVFFGAKTISCKGTQLHVKVAGAFHISKNAQVFLVLLEVDFDVVLEHPFPDISDEIRLADLPGTIHLKNLVWLLVKELFDALFVLPK